MVHPDMAQASKDYKKNPNSFKEVFASRDQLIKNGFKYWNDHWDAIYKYWAREATMSFAKKKEWPNGKQK